MNRPNWKRRAYYGVTIATMLAMTAGFALAAGPFGLGGNSTTYQGSQTTTVSTVSGLTYTSTMLVQSTGAVSASCTSGTPCNVQASSSYSCVSVATCAATDYLEQITLSTVPGTAFPGATNTIAVTIYVTATGFGTVAGTTEYYSQPITGNSLQTITQVYDIGAVGSTLEPVTSITVIAVSV